MAAPREEKRKLTFEDYLKTPFDDRERYELIEGDLLLTPAPNIRHQRILGKLEFMIKTHVLEKGLGEVFFAPCDVVLDNENVFQPDILFISRERTRIITEPNIQGAPDLVIEILSPSTQYRDLGGKKRVYARSGVKEYWIVDPEEKGVDVYTLKEKGFEISGHYEDRDAVLSPLLEGLKIPLKGIFE
ncbi:MAG: Uma2 family endonuclease [Nitrospirae bacterium]|nr:Uma2 family endonuclease [Nitrospirota bacterium]